MNNTVLHNVSRKTKIFYGSGDMGLAFTDSVLGVAFMIFLMDVVGLAPTLAGFALLIGRSWDWINDPIVGFLSDKTRTRWGRRRPYILFGIVPYAVCFAMIWSNPTLETEIAKAVYYSFAYVLYYSINTLITLPYYALTPELTSDYDERTSLTTYRMIFSLIGTGAGITLGMSIKWSPENHANIAMIGILMGTGAALPFILVFLGTKENPDYQLLPRPKLLDQLKTMFKNKPFLYAAGIILFTFLALETTQQIMIFFLKYNMRMEDVMGIISGALIVAAMASLPFWNWLSEKKDKIKAYIVGALFYCVALLLVLFQTPESGLLMLCIVAALVGLGFGAVQVLSWAIIPDTIEYNEFVSGERHEGMLYSLVTIFRKITTAFVLPGTGFILGATGYDANSMNQNNATLAAIRYLMVIVPIVSVLVAVFLALKFPINRQAFAELRKKLNGKKLQML